MANQFPTESTASGLSSTPGSTSTSTGTGTGSTYGTGSTNSTGSTGSTGSTSNGPATSIGTASGFGSSSAPAGSGTGAAVSANAQRTMDRAVQATHEAVDRAAGTVGQAAERLRTRYDHLVEMEHEWADTARTRVRENPLGAIAIALAVGLVVGRLTSHR